MPELPEVEHFRQLLLPLCSKNDTLHITKHQEHHRLQLTEQEINEIRQHYVCHNVTRKGKQLCLELTTLAGKKNNLYLYLHMGMTGRIRVPGKVENWGHENSPLEEIASSEEEHEEFPPKYTNLTFKCGSFIAAFADPRKFGKCFILNEEEYAAKDPFALLAPDALETEQKSTIEERILPKLTNQSSGIKAILLDQKRAVSGVGNWVADEVCYQCQMHPDQSFLSADEAKMVFGVMQEVCKIASDCLKRYSPYPEKWLFGFRWTKKKTSKDHQNRSIQFVTSGGRTSAIVPAIQKLHGRKKQAVPKKNTKATSPKREQEGLISLEEKEMISPAKEQVRNKKATSAPKQEQFVKQKRKNVESQKLKKKKQKESGRGEKISLQTEEIDTSATFISHSCRSGRVVTPPRYYGS